MKFAHRDVHARRSGYTRTSSGSSRSIRGAALISQISQVCARDAWQRRRGSIDVAWLARAARAGSHVGATAEAQHPAEVYGHTP